MIKDWINDIINGVGGLNDYRRCEMAIIETDEEIAGWIIQCLGNPKCKGSQEVLIEILKHRNEIRRQEA